MNLSGETISEEALRSRLACKRLIQYMHQHDLKNGSQLPPQEVLRGRFKFGHATLSRAMRSMTSHGLIERRQRTGTRVANRDAMIPNLWTVAIPIFSISEQDDLFINTLVRYLEAELDKAACGWRTYLRRSDPRDKSARLSDFPNLESDLRRHRVDAVLYPTLIDHDEIQYLKSRGVPVCGIFHREPDSCGVGIEQRDMITQAAGRLCQSGCRHIAVAGHGALVGTRHEPLRQAFAAATKSLVLAGGKAELITASTIATRQTGRYLGRFLLKQPAFRRPDGLIILSDVVAIGLTETIAADSYRPQIIVQTNRQVPLAFALPAACYEVDVAEMARIGVQMIVQRMQDPSMPDKKTRVAPRWVEPVSAAEHPDEPFLEKIQILDHGLLLS